MSAISDSFKTICPELKGECDTISNILETMNDSFFRVVNAGPMNPGKSTLFNAFFGKQDLFKVADKRETVKNQEEILKHGKDSFIFIDTPGCSSAELKDDEVAYQAFCKADLVLFVHNITTGGLNKSEMNLLKSLKKIFGDSDFQTRICVVCTRSDEVNEDDDIIKNTEEIKKQIINSNALGGELPFFVVSPKLYLDGLNNSDDKAKDIFIKESKFTLLQNHVFDSYKKLGKRGESELKDFMIKLEALKNDTEYDIDSQQKEVDKLKSKARRKWQSTLDDIKPAWLSCKN